MEPVKRINGSGKAVVTLHAQGYETVAFDLNGVIAHRNECARMRPVSQTPWALEHLDEILPAAKRRLVAMFLDFDGTLTSIVPGPQDAELSDTMRASLQHLAALCPVAVISGRDLDDVRARVALPYLYYAGCHGFQILGPGLSLEKGVEFLPLLDAAERALRDALAGIAGCEVERKRFAIAVHYRRVRAEQVHGVLTRVQNIHAGYPGLRLSLGKKILELQPGISWNKGQALLWMTQSMEHGVLPVYLGDDTTDEDAFDALAGNGVGILVGEHSQPETAASYRLRDGAEVQQFLQAAIERLRQPQTATATAPEGQTEPPPNSARRAES